MPIDNILLIEPDDSARRELMAALKTLPGKVAQADSFESAQSHFHEQPYDWILISDALSATEIPDLLGAADRALPAPPVLHLARTEDRALKGLQQGASDYLLPPFTSSRVELAWIKAQDWTRLQRMAGPTQFPETQARLFQGTSPSLDSLRNCLRKFSHTNAPVLIQGEPGSGKGAFAQTLHRQSPRAAECLMRYDCSQALDPNEITAAIFGEETYDTSGHWSRREGLLEANPQGTLVLQEISLLPAEAQKRLLQFLRDHAFERLGGKERVQSKTRILATSSRSLNPLIENKSFREDLFLTLSILPVQIPALKERREDIPELAENCRQQSGRRIGVEAPVFSPEALEALQVYQWPGNVQELEATVARAVILGRKEETLQVEHLFPDGIPEGQAGTPGSDSLEDLASIEKKHIFMILKKCNENRTHAARHLGISIRTLRNKLREYREAAQAGQDPGV